MRKLKMLAVFACAVIVGLCGVSVFGQAKKITGPKEIDGLVLWLDAADANTITKDEGNNKVSKWKDKSGKDFNAEQSNQGLQPVYSAAAVNQLPGIVFDGVSIIDISQFGQKMFTAFVVGQRSDDNQTPFQRINSDVNRGFTIDKFGEEWDLFPEYRVNGVAAKNPSDWKNNIAVVTGVKGTHTPTGFRVGFGSPAFAQLNGPISEIIFFERNLTADEITAVEQYLAAKWKINISGK